MGGSSLVLFFHPVLRAEAQWSYAAWQCSFLWSVHYRWLDTFADLNYAWGTCMQIQRIKRMAQAKPLCHALVDMQEPEEMFCKSLTQSCVALFLGLPRFRFHFRFRARFVKNFPFFGSKQSQILLCDRPNYMNMWKLFYSIIPTYFGIQEHTKGIL